MCGCFRSRRVRRNSNGDMYLMCVSEWGKGIERDGVSSTVGEYSISSVGPGPRAKRHWALARERGLKTIAKVQVNSSWELSAVPYLPLDLVEKVINCEYILGGGLLL